MANDLIFHLALANLAGSAAILVILVLRRVARAKFGAGLAYGLWLIAPAAMLASQLPARTMMIATPVKATPVVAVAHRVIAMSELPHHAAAAPTLDLSQILVGVWLSGVIAALLLLAIGQRRALAGFGSISVDPKDTSLARASNLGVGPALVGVFRPRVIVPSDFEARFDAKERALILAHERTHLTRGHAFINGLTALIKAGCWFNPLVYIGARCARVDQEMACDAAVVARFPGQRQTYAKALLKTQLAFTPLPLGCEWPAQSPSLLERRIEMFMQQKPGRARLWGGVAMVVALTAGAGVAAWSAQPPVIIVTPAFPTADAAARVAAANSLAVSNRPAAPPVQSPAPAPAQQTPDQEAPTTIGFACLGNNCVASAQTSVRDPAIARAIQTGDVKAVMAAGGGANDVLAAWMAADAAAGTDIKDSQGRSLADRLKGSRAEFVTTQGGALSVRAIMADGGVAVLGRTDLAQFTPPPGTPDFKEGPPPTIVHVHID